MQVPDVTDAIDTLSIGAVVKVTIRVVDSLVVVLEVVEDVEVVMMIGLEVVGVLHVTPS